ncbi:WhiB family transcriptional regulator [Nocardiopsis tropica]|uniref:WhiB family transcriptional regulator n=1 Tax=Nocardiopsis tropica TaxID=109330 RepID=A0ABU7L1L2_9ACTN|nr:WhiB family transcriptional regulator [Nocardiopsis umidischolae]MEE2054777.1 WhiB family transcriptional regulator [Nocardiopsis umidischolae]
MDLTRPPAWHANAACQDEQAELFFEVFREASQDRRARQERAVAVCASCPVRTQCLDDALADAVDAQSEVRGGLTAEQRRTLLREAADAESPPPPPVESDLPGMRRGRIDAAATHQLVADMRDAGHTLAGIAAAAGLSKASVKGFALRRHPTVDAGLAEALACAHTALMKTEREVAA